MGTLTAPFAQSLINAGADVNLSFSSVEAAAYNGEPLIVDMPILAIAQFGQPSMARFSGCRRQRECIRKIIWGVHC